MKEVLAIGADGIPKGWVAAVCRGPAADSTPRPDQLRTEVAHFDSVEQIVNWRNNQVPTATVGLDVPMGLLEDVGARPCDEQARKLLKGRSSSVFNPPARFLLEVMEQPDHKARWEGVQRLVAERGGIGISRQTLGIMDKVQQADDHLHAQPKDQGEAGSRLAFTHTSRAESLPPPRSAIASAATAPPSADAPARRVVFRRKTGPTPQCDDKPRGGRAESPRHSRANVGLQDLTPFATRANVGLQDLTPFAPVRHDPVRQSLLVVAITLVLVLIYLALVAGAARIVLSEGRALWGLVGVALAVPVPALGLYGTLHPFPEGSERWGVWIAAGAVVLSAAWVLSLRVRNPQRLERAAEYALSPD